MSHFQAVMNHSELSHFQAVMNHSGLPHFQAVMDHSGLLRCLASDPSILSRARREGELSRYLSQEEGKNLKPRKEEGKKRKEEKRRKKKRKKEDEKKDVNLSGNKFEGKKMVRFFFFDF